MLPSHLATLNFLQINPLLYHLAFMLSCPEINITAVQEYDFLVTSELHKLCLRKMLLCLYERVEEQVISSVQLHYLCIADFSLGSSLLQQRFPNLNVYSNHLKIVKRQILILEVCLGWGSGLCISYARP